MSQAENTLRDATIEAQLIKPEATTQPPCDYHVRLDISIRHDNEQDQHKALNPLLNIIYRRLLKDYIALVDAIRYDDKSEQNLVLSSLYENIEALADSPNF